MQNKISHKDLIHTQFLLTVLYFSGSLKFFKDGDGLGCLWRWWHPLTWVLAPLIFVLSCVMSGVPQAYKERHQIGFGLSPFWKKKENENKIEWL